MNFQIDLNNILPHNMPPMKIFNTKELLPL